MKNVMKIGLLALSLTGFCKAHAQTEVAYYTSMGNFNIVLTDTLIPRTVDSFIARVAEKFYDGLIFHRVIDNFMIQGGDPLGNGTGGPGYTMPDEFDPTLKNVPGALAMANAGPNTNGCQFYINLISNPHLDNHYTVFGKVTTNFSVVQSIGHVATNSTNNKPLTDVVIDSIRIVHLYVPAVVPHIGNNIAPAAYPNPANGVFSIDLPEVLTTVEITNLSGRVVYCTEAKGTIKVDLTNQPAGLYFVRTANENGRSVNKLLLQ